MTKETQDPLKNLPLNNEFLQQFNILSLLGKGSFCTVYKVQRKKDQKIYALKHMNLSTSSKHQKQSALNEIQYIASLQHPSIIQYHESFYIEENESLFLVMEYVSGGDIQQLIQKHVKQYRMIDENLIWEYALQMIIGLKVLHQSGIVHRDFKSANVFLDSGHVCKIGDFNVSLHLKQGFIKIQGGTPNYSAPEVWSSKPHDYKCDSWSLGCILYEMCTGSHPFQGETMDDLYYAVQKVDYKPIPQIYSQDMVEFIECLLVHNPQKRSSMKDLLQKDFIQRKIADFLPHNPHLSYLKPYFKNQLYENNKNNSQNSSKFEFYDQQTQLLKTMYLPKNLSDLKYILPQPNYESDKIEEEMLRKKEQQQQVKLRNNKRNIMKKQSQSQQPASKINISQQTTGISSGTTPRHFSQAQTPGQTPTSSKSKVKKFEYGMLKTGFKFQQNHFSSIQQDSQKPLQSTLYNPKQNTNSVYHSVEPNTKNMSEFIKMQNQLKQNNQNNGHRKLIVSRKNSSIFSNEYLDEEMDTIQDKLINQQQYSNQQETQTPQKTQKKQMQPLNMNISNLIKNNKSLIKQARSKSIQPSALASPHVKLPHVTHQQQQSQGVKIPLDSLSQTQRYPHHSNHQQARSVEKHISPFLDTAHTLGSPTNARQQKQKPIQRSFQQQQGQQQKQNNKLKHQQNVNNLHLSQVDKQHEKIFDTLLPKTVNVMNLRAQFEKNQKMQNSRNQQQYYDLDGKRFDFNSNSQMYNKNKNCINA